MKADATTEDLTSVLTAGADGLAGPASTVLEIDLESVAPSGGVPDDPQIGWHIDAINVEGAWADYTGAGVLVAIVDDGVHHWHTDLDDNYNTAVDFDARGGDDDAAAESSDYHGTWVAGMVAAEANGAGTVGVAYEAEIAGFRMGYGSAGSLSQVEDVIRESGQTADVSNNSWSFTSAFSDNFKAWYFADSAAALRDGVADGRGGLGSVYVFAAGNGRTSGDDANYHNFQNSPYTIAVAATTSTGDHAYYSNPGAALLVAAPGSSVTTTSYSSSYATVSGTSFAAPTVSGVVALMLEANPDLGYRDVQEILAYSAQLTDAGDPGWQVNGAGNWNGGGLRFSHDYGFGIVDATAAVRLAETWTAQSTYHNEISTSASRSPGLAIPDNSPTGVVDTLTIDPGNAIDIDTVEIDINITHAFIGDLKITLISPEGTEAVLADRPGGAGNGPNNINFVFTANTFWGESGAGTWQLKVSDHAGQDVGTLNSWTLTLNGDPTSDDDVYVYTDACGDLSAAELAGRETLSDSGGYDVLNLSAVTTGVDLDLAPGGGGFIAGNAVSIGSGTVIENVLAGAGDDAIRGNDSNNVIEGGSGGDRIEGEAGNDRVMGEGGHDLLFGGDDDDILEGGDGDDVIFGDDGNDTLEGGIGSDFIFGGEGDDWLSGGINPDTLDGGGGTDTVDYGFAAVGLDIDLASGTMMVGGSSESIVNFENAVGSASADFVRGTAGDNTLEGGEGGDTLKGRDGDDLLLGGGGNDSILGGNGNDTLSGGFGADTLDGGAGVDTIDFGFAGVGLTIDLVAGQMLVGGSSEQISSFENAIGGEGRDVIFGSDDSNTINGGAGADSLFGGGGDDRISGGIGADYLDGGVGTDTVDFGFAAVGLVIDLATGTMSVGTSNESLVNFENAIGGAGADVIIGTSHSNTLQGGKGGDTISGSGGDDVLYGGEGADLLVGGSGDDL